MKLGLIIEGEYDEPVISKLVKRICEQSKCSVGISKERIRFGRGFGNISRKLVVFAKQLQTAGSKIIIVIVDNDRMPHNSRLNSLKRKINKVSIPVAVGVAIESVESWLLADEQALNFALGTTQIPRLPSSSKIRKPKDKLAQIVKKYANQPVSRNLYSQIADRADKRVLDKRCRSFNHFHNELKTCLKMVKFGI